MNSSANINVTLDSVFPRGMSFFQDYSVIYFAALNLIFRLLFSGFYPSLSVLLPMAS